MKSELITILRDPFSGLPLSVAANDESISKNVVNGSLLNPDGTSYPIVDGIPRFIEIHDSAQQQTADSFGFKWNQENTFSSAEMQNQYDSWLLPKYNFANREAAEQYFGSRHRILDAGCGAGLAANLWLRPNWRTASDAMWVGLDISTAVDIAQKRLGYIEGTHFVQGDILHPPFVSDSFDTIFSEGVLHHTSSTRAAIESLSRLLCIGGEMLFYVYRKKGPIREFTDDYIRELVSVMSPREAWDFLLPLTRLGQALSELNVTVDVAEAVPFLGIEAGPQDVQRLLYWNVAKMYWNDAMSFEENHHVNFDWYHPKYAHRQTEEEVRTWCENTGLDIIHFHTQESGFTVRAIKK